MVKVGFASLDITPPLGSETPGGFTKRHLWDIHDPLHVKAAVFESDGVKVALVGVDALSIKASTVKVAREIAEKTCGIPSTNIMIGASHTHQGGPTVEWSGDPENLVSNSSNPELIKRLLETAPSADRNYLNMLSYKIASAIVLADKRKVEAVCSVGLGREDKASFNRRFKMKNGRQMTHPGKGNPDIIEPAGPIDPDVGVIGAWSLNGEFLGCVVNFACHGTAMGGDGYSADWPYYLDKTIRSVMDEDSIVVFLNGACGNVTQVNNLSLRAIEFGEAAARRVGQRVGAEALKVLADANIETGSGELKPIAASQKFPQLERRKVTPERLKWAYEIVNKKKPQEDYRWVFARDIILLNELNKIEPRVTCEIQAIQIGPAIFISNPAELFCQLGLEIKAASHFPYTFVVELANGCIGYVPTEEAMGPLGGGYETRMGMHSFLVPTAGRDIVRASIELIKQFTPGRVPEPKKVKEPSKPWDYGSVGPEEL
jgi:hypothetical protein